ncbi:M14 family metallopeptidase [Pseudomarimonas arenosa]|uniref:M14 family metallocarboxypeptidase n=1 Tax=Pseudomarimonas arenosa TaxID=2774145 RepID=A0AAW3ZNC2_9GAMM|nr:M14 family metallocarboxypeptidase [Pseudomarimonas arenosa]MBD8527658.1 M14 family metallocarboxypeptidase [Pseudomarimonas arenosa]
MNEQAAYPIGIQGKPWGAPERAEWLSRQVQHRRYAEDVLPRIAALQERFEVQQYGELHYPPDRYSLMLVKSRGWDAQRPSVLVTGGVHGYETSGVMGALMFLEQAAERYLGRVNLMVLPCISPWAYERIHRWNADAVDPNRSFREHSEAEESAAVWRLIAPLRDQFLLHIDLHETTDTDGSEFRPALAARDGKMLEPEGIPDGFYVVGDTANPQPEFQQAVIAAVAKVTHIAPADENGEIIGSPVVAPGVINYPFKELGLCAGLTDAPFTTTTEVYPDSDRATPEQCNAAQVAAVCAAIDHALGNSEAP